ncbi:major capsid protein [Escherichia coli]|nr:major capsid protein [Escherichia coli]
MPQSFVINNAPLELLGVDELALIHSNYAPMDTWLLDKLFPRRKSFTTSTVPIAELETESDIAPLVAPQIPGKPFDRTTAIQVQHLNPAYLKPKNQVTPATAWDTALLARLRDSGIISTGSNQLSTSEQYVIAQIETMKRNHDAIDNRKILMAAELVTTGQIILESDDYTKNVVSYGRDASLAFTPANAWDQVGATPVEDIDTMAQRMLDEDGGEAKMILTTGKVWSVLEKNADFKAKFVAPYAGISIPYRPELNASRSAKFKGYLGDIEIWTYDATYKNKGQTKRFIPQDYFALIADNNGYVTQCKIENIHANGLALEYFDRQWYEEDPSGIMLLTESAPLVVPSNKNGICGGTGFITL